MLDCCPHLFSSEDLLTMQLSETVAAVTAIARIVQNTFSVFVLSLAFVSHDRQQPVVKHLLLHSHELFTGALAYSFHMTLC